MSSFFSRASCWNFLRVLSTQVPGGFVGADIGLFANSHGKPSGNIADFDYFEYAPRHDFQAL